MDDRSPNRCAIAERVESKTDMDAFGECLRQGDPFLRTQAKNPNN